MSKLDDIAKVAGVSRHTVARILSGKRRENWPSKQAQGDRIRRLAEEMGYRPNASARALVLGRFGCVGLLHSTKETQSYVSPVMLSAIDEGLVKHDLHLSIARLDDNKLTNPEYVPKILREWLCDGLIINYHGVPPKMRKLITDFRIPAVWLNCRLEHDAVYMDDFTASVRGTEHLVEYGHRKIMYADASYFLSRRSGHQHHNRATRKDAYSDVVTKAGGQPLFLHDDEKSAGAHFIDNLRKILSDGDRPTALVAYSGTEIRAARIVAAELGLKIPQDLSIIGFRGEGDLDPMIWDDTVMIGPEREMCMEAVEMVVRKIAHPQIEFASKAIPFSIHAGDTVATCKE